MIACSMGNMAAPRCTIVSVTGSLVEQFNIDVDDDEAIADDCSIECEASMVFSGMTWLMMVISRMMVFMLCRSLLMRRVTPMCGTSLLDCSSWNGFGSFCLVSLSISLVATAFGSWLSHLSSPLGSLVRSRSILILLASHVGGSI